MELVGLLWREEPSRQRKICKHLRKLNLVVQRQRACRGVRFRGGAVILGLCVTSKVLGPSVAGVCARVQVG